MNTTNETLVTNFLLLGLTSIPELKIAYFIIFLLIYILTVTSNTVIIVIVRVDSKLHTPMYFFLSNFAFLEVWYTTTTVPTLLSGFLTKNNSISHQGCIAQLCFFFCLGATEFFLLAVMAFDRYIAICKPLHYSALMNHSVCGRMAAGSWLCGFASGLTFAILASQLIFCADNRINHFFCDFGPLLSIACPDKVPSDITFHLISYVVVLCSLLLTAVSYFKIGRTILRIPSRTGRLKAFSTCASHLTVVVIFYGTVIFVYLRPASNYSSNMDKVLSVFYSVITPFMNPLIYSLRNQDVQKALWRALAKLLKSFHRHQTLP